MGEEADRFRQRARECRELAAAAKEGYSRTTLLQIAAELEEEADGMEAEQGDGSSPE